MKHVLLLCVLAGMLTGCRGAGSVPQTAATVVPSTPTPGARSYEFPASIDPTARYLFYLHGKIIEDQGLPAVHAEYGPYEYEAILEALGSEGAVVISEQRPRNADADAYARRVVEQVRMLLEAGVPARNITVVGASKGGYIAAMVSFLLDEPALNYVLLGTCHPSTVDLWKRGDFQFHGNVLAIRDVADLEYSGSCDEMFELSEGKGLGRHTEIVLQLGTGHGILYRPLHEWVQPTLQWAGQ